ncbi:MAG: AAA family ATPase [Bacilli bacterium]|nr:AAA family ATPase [Bacilli bacterium]
MKKCVALLMEKNIIKENTFIYKPVHCIEGKIDDKGIFIDNLNKEYLSIEDQVLAFSEITQCYAYPVEMDILKKQYPEFEDDEIRLNKLYYDEMSENIYIGINEKEKTGITILPLNSQTLLDSYANINEEDNFQNIGIVISEEYLKKLLEINELNVIKEKLQEIKAGFDQFCESTEQINDNVLDDIYITIEYIDYLLKLDDCIEIIKKLKKCNIKTKEECYTIDKSVLRKLFDENNIEVIKDNLLTIKKTIEKKELEKQQKKYEEIFDNNVQYDVKNIYEEICKSVIGQEEAIKDVVTTVVMDKYSKKASDKTRCLLVGPTGTGKTKIISTISEQFNLPFIHVDSTQLTAQGYVGGKLEDKLSQLLMKANGDLEKAENGIFVFDEIDKKGSSSNDDVSGRAVLNMILPFIDGTDYTINYNNKVIKFNTSRLTIFAAGAFTSVFNGKKSLSKNAIGLTATFDKKEDNIELKPMDFVKYGLIPDEFIGRFPIISQLNKMTETILKDILVKSNTSPLLIEKEKLKNFNIDLLYDDQFIDAVAKKAISLEIGARSLKSIIENTIKEARFQVLCNLNIYDTITLTKETVENNKVYKLERKGM